MTDQEPKNIEEPTGIEASICREIVKRQQMGKNKYGTELADNPADICERLQHLKEEMLDGAMYCEWAIRKMAEVQKDIEKMLPLVKAVGRCNPDEVPQHVMDAWRAPSMYYIDEDEYRKRSEENDILGW